MSIIAPAWRLPTATDLDASAHPTGEHVSEIVPVEALCENQCGRIVELLGPMDWQHRLEELGLRVGNLVRLVRRGEPCILAVHDLRVSLRCERGTMILVELEPATGVRAANGQTSSLQNSNPSGWGS